MNNESTDDAQVVFLGNRWLHFIIEGGEEVNLAKSSSPDKPFGGKCSSTNGEEELKDNPSAPPS